ncbi:hypothetical protein MRB53_012484 [Persea americana]|uniref:Uncharacterized protein n=1 Tax=Persea americana TaxID=3435 RepID=A0ACC2LXK0_PERAE|nr:hypothetical protein MRB53_012484 [Persea americana]
MVEKGVISLNSKFAGTVYNKEGLLDKLGGIRWPENLDWIHKLSIDFNQEQEVDANDDLARELAFYTQSLEGTRHAFEKLQSMELPFLQPLDYYAEMVKTNAPMEKLRSRLLEEEKWIEEAEERRKAREAKRIAEEVQAQKLKERAQQKKQEIESVKKWRKQRQQSGFSDGSKGIDEMGLYFEDEKTCQRSRKRIWRESKTRLQGFQVWIWREKRLEEAEHCGDNR